MSRSTVKVAPPPIPENPAICRWCGCKKREVYPGGPRVCDASCAPNESAPWLATCLECNREFETGRHRAALCPECDLAMQKAIDRENQIDRHGMYTSKEYGDHFRRKGRAR